MVYAAVSKDEFCRNRASKTKPQTGIQGQAKKGESEMG